MKTTNLIIICVTFILCWLPLMYEDYHPVVIQKPPLNGYTIPVYVEGSSRGEIIYVTCSPNYVLDSDIGGCSVVLPNN